MQLSVAGLDKLQQLLISSALGKESHGLQMDIAHDGVASCFHCAMDLLTDDDSSFMDNFVVITKLYTNSQIIKHIV